MQSGTLDCLRLSNMTLKRSSCHWCSYHILIFIISHLWSGIDSESIRGYSINTIDYVTVQRGLCVYIPCRFTVPETKTISRHAWGIWINVTGHTVAYKNNRDFFSNGRFFLVGDVWRGDCSLYIEDPLYQDEGRYRFRLADIQPFSYLDIRPYINVTDLTDKPEILPIKSWVDGENVTLTCTAPGTCNNKTINPQISWEGDIQNTSVKNQVTHHGNNTKTHFSTITFTARKEQNNSTLSCVVRLKEGLNTSQQISINVEFSPQKVNGNISMCRKTGKLIECTCIIQSFPESTVIWKMNGESINNNTKANFSSVTSNSITESTMTIIVNMEESRTIHCVASNKHGELVQQLFNKMVTNAFRDTETFPVTAIVGGCLAAVLVVIGILFIVFYKKRKMKQRKENSEWNQISGDDPIYCNPEMLSNGLHEVGPITQEDQQQPSEDGPVPQNDQEIEYISIDFSRLKPIAATEEAETEYAVIKNTD